MDSLTKFVEVYPLAHDRAFDTARCLSKMVLKHGCKPAIISCDRGTHFTGNVMQEFCKNLNIQLKFHVAWRPESSGILERAHRTLKNSLYIMAKERNSNWVDILDYCVAALNSQFNAATKWLSILCFIWSPLERGTSRLAYAKCFITWLTRVWYVIRLPVSRRLVGTN